MRLSTDSASRLPRPTRALAATAPPKRPLVGSTTAILLLALLGLPTAGLAGTGRLLSQWMSRAPQLDGQIGAAEWSEAKLVDLGAGVTVRIGNDARTLYLAILDAGDPTYGSGDAFHLYFDDEGGVAPVLDDDLFDGSLCHLAEEIGEGLISFGPSQSVDYFEIAQGGQCTFLDITDRASFRAAGRPEGTTYEAALPLDGPAPLRALAGERFGLMLRTFRNGVAVACLPSCAALNPPDFRNLILASGGCNTGAQKFGAGEPRIGLPLDWTSVIPVGSGSGWNQSGLDHEPELCIGNATGGSGAAACVANAFEGSTHTISVLQMPLSLVGQTSATVRLRAVLRVDPNGFGQDDELRVVRLFQEGSDSILEWSGEDHSATVDLPLFLDGIGPHELWFLHTTLLAGGLEGGFAQIDDVELFCGPILFADGFDSGLTTHWSATLP